MVEVFDKFLDSLTKMLTIVIIVIQIVDWINHKD